MARTVRLASCDEVSLVHIGCERELCGMGDGQDSRLEELGEVDTDGLRKGGVLAHAELVRQAEQHCGGAQPDARAHTRNIRGVHRSVFYSTSERKRWRYARLRVGADERGRRQHVYVYQRTR